MARNPYPNKISAFGVVKLDLSADTITSDNLVSGITAHDASGAPITGTLVVQKYYTGSTAPPASLGNDGDIYFQS